MLARHPIRAWTGREGRPAIGVEPPTSPRSRPQNLAIGAAAVGLAEQEGDLFRRVIGWSLGLLLVMCVIVYLQSTSAFSWMVV
ncbi:MAG TPA: L-lactate permease [Solirubrobacteraceae bacterium]|nr:L-lactate permease [Solirubrobacteraceae bacterium]